MLFLIKESTIVMAFRQCFLNSSPPEVTKIVLPKVLQNFEKTPNCTYWPKELNQKGFPRNIQYRTRPKGPPFSFFSALRFIFFRKNYSSKSPSFNFLEFWDRMNVEKSQTFALSVFRHCETFFNFCS